MTKIFYTEHDIDELVIRGQMILNICENVVLTELAYEKAEKLGLKLIQVNELPPSAPIRPYLSQSVMHDQPCNSYGIKNEFDNNLTIRIKDAVKQKIGASIEEELLDNIINRILISLRLK